jgi:choline dehydrogenase-like flavoprotein
MSNVIQNAADLPNLQSISCDAVVIGSGAAGSVVAAELSEAGWRVVVLEEGPHITPEDHGRMRPSESLRNLWRDGGLTFALGLGDTPMINVMMGKCIGGSSVLTGGVCFRTPDPVLRVWNQERGLHEYTPEKLDPAFRHVEQRVHVEEVPIAMRSRSTIKFAEGARKQGFELKSLRRNTKGCNGCGQCNFGCPCQAKMSVDISFLPRALAHRTQVLANCRVAKILLQGDRATGVLAHAVSPQGKTLHPITVHAKHVVLAAGAYFSPQLLAQQGIGKRSGQVGKNLTLHPAFRMMARFKDSIEGWKGSLQSAYSDHFEHQKITMVGMFVPPGVLAATMKGIGSEHHRRARQIPNLAVFGGMIHDEAGGRIHSAFGKTFATYRMAKEDRAVIPTLIRSMANIYFDAGAEEVFLPILGLPGLNADQLRKLDLDHISAKKLECSSQHPLGTNRMGSSPSNSVVNSDGETWDVRNLHVIDGSIVPTSLGVNPQLTIMGLATHLAWKLREKSITS